MAGIAFVAGDVEEVGDVEWSVGGDQHTRAEAATVLGQCKKRLSSQRPERDFFTFWKPEDGVVVPPCFQDGSRRAQAADGPSGAAARAASSTRASAPQRL